MQIKKRSMQDTLPPTLMAISPVAQLDLAFNLLMAASGVALVMLLWKGVRKRGPKVSAFSQPDSFRILFFFMLCGILICDFLKALPEVPWVRFLVTSFFWLVVLVPMIVGCMQFHENGLWQGRLLIPWKKFSSYAWREGGELMLVYGQKSREMVIKVPDQNQPEIDALLARQFPSVTRAAQSP